MVVAGLSTQGELSCWWTPQVIAVPEIGSVSGFGFVPDYHKELKVEDLVPERIVQHFKSP
ncbi:hypothetical protein [Niabella aquatica]